MENLDQENLENKKTNKELLEEIRKEYPKFKDFWDAVLQQTRDGKGSIYSGDNPSPLYVVRFFASKLNNIKIQTDVYTSALENDPQAEMPVQLYKNNMSLLQGTIGQASDAYYGEAEILDKDGKIKD